MNIITQIPPEGTISSDERVARANRIIIELRAAGDTSIDDFLFFIEEALRREPAGAAANHPEFERGIRDHTMAIERSMGVMYLERLAPTAPGIVVEGERYRRLAPSMLDVMLMSGWARVSRSLYRKRGGDGATFDPLAKRVGLVEGTTTLAAARVVSRQVSSTSESESAMLLAEQRTMRPSPAHVGRIMRGLGICLGNDVESFEEELRLAELRSETLPDRVLVKTLAVSLDGIMVRMKDAPNTPGASKNSSIPNGHREAATATVSLYAEDGSRLHTVKFGRMPESKKVTLHRQLEQELKAFIDRYPEAKVVAVADAARENWRILDAIAESVGVSYLAKIVDYYHARDHLLEALRLSGARTPAKEKWSKVLLEEHDGADQVLQELARRRAFKSVQASPSRLKDFDKEITYFTNNRDMMQYPEHREKNLPIGSGVEEAACKTLVAQRLKLSGMSWLQTGGQAVISFRGFIQSERFDFAWAELEKLLPDDTFEIDTNTNRKKPSWSQAA